MLYPHLCACIRLVEHLRLGALGGFCRLNLLNVPHIVCWLEHPVCSRSSERMSGERDVEIQVNETKKEQQEDRTTWKL